MCTSRERQGKVSCLKKQHDAKGQYLRHRPSFFIPTHLPQNHFTTILVTACETIFNFFLSSVLKWHKPLKKLLKRLLIFVLLPFLLTCLYIREFKNGESPANTTVLQGIWIPWARVDVAETTWRPRINRRLLPDHLYEENRRRLTQDKS